MFPFKETVGFGFLGQGCRDLNSVFGKLTANVRVFRQSFVSQSRGAAGRLAGPRVTERAVEGEEETRPGVGYGELGRSRRIF